MLKSFYKTALTEAGPTYVDLFVAKYDVLRQWAYQFTDRDQARADDLPHDLFIHFTRVQPDLASSRISTVTFMS